MIRELNFTKKPNELLSDEELQRIQVELGFQLPETFIEFCKIYNGGYPTVDNAVYPVPHTYNDFYEEYGLQCKGVPIDGLYGLSDKLKSCDARKEYKQLREELEMQLFPISFDLLGNHVVIVASDKDGLVYWRDHELWDTNGSPRLFRIAENLEQFYNGLKANPYAEE